MWVWVWWVFIMVNRGRGSAGRKDLIILIIARWLLFDKGR